MDAEVPSEAIIYKPDAADERFVFNQLIAYIGNKRKLLAPIMEALARVGRGGTFVDFFAGSGVVSRLAKLAHYRVVANDWEPYSQALNQAFIATNNMPPFKALGGVASVYPYLNDELPPVEGYIARHYCPRCDEAPDLDNERMFYTQENGRRIDAVREQIVRWRADDLIDLAEEGLLLASLIYAASYHSNTSGVFKAFHRGWGGATRTAWYRIRAPLRLRPPTLYNNQQPNLALCADANLLAREITGEVAYLDPPYNQHQYGANYHLLNTVALWDQPPLSPHTRIDGRIVNKSAIRQDWLSARRSAYCYRTSAVQALADLLDALRFRSIIVSYSSDGIIPLDELLRLLHARGAVDYIEQPYKRYRVSSQRYSPRSHTLELTFLVDTTRLSNRFALQAMREQLHHRLDRLALQGTPLGS